MGLWEVMLNKMYVKWKMLFGLGFVFWILLCLHDTYFVDPTTKFYYSDSDEYEWLSEVSNEEIMAEPTSFRKVDNIKLPNDNYSLGIYLLFWNVATFLITIAICYLTKIGVTCFWKYRDSRINKSECPEISEITNKKSISSKIPVFQMSKSVTNISEGMISEGQDSDNSKSTTHVDLRIQSSKHELANRCVQQMEKECAKLRDEMISIQANSLKEQSALSRKLDYLAKEKRELCKQLMASQKDNRSIKQQLDELLAERSLHMRRLDSATKQLKVNNKGKKAAIAKFEESQIDIVALKQEIDRINSERDLLENKLRNAQVENEGLKMLVTKLEKSNEQINIDVDEDEVCNDSPRDAKPEFPDMTQSHKDVQRVQLRLVNLERSLDKLKLSNWMRNSDSKIDDFVDASPHLIATRPEYPLVQEDHQQSNDVELKIEIDNLTDEQRRKFLNPNNLSGNDCLSGSKRLDVIMEELSNDGAFDRVSNVLQNSSSGKLDSLENLDFFEDTPINETSTSVNEDDDTDEWDFPKNRIVSNSPAFQKFLRSMDRVDKDERKFTLPTNTF